ncbi:4Fe-4S binding protein [Plantactinospora endophytica]|uniref:NuoI/complex I 23 kDa subunit family protein n=1 Tax=Plantactinospora endophytica TaxID=673535 RepID=UPI00363F5D24
MSVPGEGLAKGLAVTLKTMTRRSHTQQYPDVAPDLPPRSRGVIALLEENCTVCMLCARECPDWCIYIDSHKEEVAVPGAARPRQRNVLDRFDIDFSLCMYCGICIEVCPFDALYWSPEFEYAEYDIRDLLHDKEHLGEWMATVPPPPAHDPNGEPAKEETAALKAAAPGAAGDRSAGPAVRTRRPARPATARPGTTPASAPPAADEPTSAPPASAPPAADEPTSAPPASAPPAADEPTSVPPASAPPASHRPPRR